MDNFYNVNISQLKKALIPTFWRRPKLEALLEAYIKPLVSLYSRFVAFKTDTDYKQSINSQVVYMQKMLNDAYDPAARRIYIKNATPKEPVWFYEPEDEKPVTFNEPGDNRDVYFFEPEDYELYNADFTVFVPIAIQPLTNSAENTFITALRGKVDYYKLYSKNYNIKFYE